MTQNELFAFVQTHCNGISLWARNGREENLSLGYLAISFIIFSEIKNEANREYRYRV